MKSHQSLAESRLSQLRAEENELQTILSDAIYVSGVDEKADHPTASNSEREMRYLDQRSPLLLLLLPSLLLSSTLLSPLSLQTLQGRDEIESQSSTHR
jgi:hypothetical protein